MDFQFNCKSNPSNQDGFPSYNRSFQIIQVPVHLYSVDWRALYGALGPSSFISLINSRVQEWSGALVLS